MRSHSRNLPRLVVYKKLLVFARKNTKYKVIGIAARNDPFSQVTAAPIPLPTASIPNIASA